LEEVNLESSMTKHLWQYIWFNCLNRAGGDEIEAKAKVKEKYLDSFLKRDLYFFLGTTKQFHNVAPNPFIIVGVFCPPIPSPNQQITILAFNIMM